MSMNPCTGALVNINKVKTKCFLYKGRVKTSLLVIKLSSLFKLLPGRYCAMHSTESSDCSLMSIIVSMWKREHKEEKGQICVETYPYSDLEQRAFTQTCKRLMPLSYTLTFSLISKMVYSSPSWMLILGCLTVLG